MLQVLRHLLTRYAAQACLGLIFIAACCIDADLKSWTFSLADTKVADPPSFAKMIYNYRLVPAEMINPLAIYLPWIELAAGLALITGLAGRGGTALVGGLLLVFIGALAINLWRGHPVDCGCFSILASEKTCAEMRADMVWRISLDGGMLAMVGYLLWAGPVSWLGGGGRGKRQDAGTAA